MAEGTLEHLYQLWAAI